MFAGNARSDRGQVASGQRRESILIQDWIGLWRGGGVDGGRRGGIGVVGGTERSGRAAWGVATLGLVATGC